jgi:hypothetical protein
MSLHELENPFTWRQGRPLVVAARKPINGDFLVIFETVSGSEQGGNKALVSANCDSKTLRLVDQESYERHLEQSGYDLFGRKLPAWDVAGYDEMLAVMVLSKFVPAGRSMMFGIACKWETYGSSAAA